MRSRLTKLIVLVADQFGARMFDHPQPFRAAVRAVLDKPGAAAVVAEATKTIRRRKRQPTEEIYGEWVIVAHVETEQPETNERREPNHD